VRWLKRGSMFLVQSRLLLTAVVTDVAQRPARLQQHLLVVGVQQLNQRRDEPGCNAGAPHELWEGEGGGGRSVWNGLRLNLLQEVTGVKLLYYSHVCYNFTHSSTCSDHMIKICSALNKWRKVKCHDPKLVWSMSTLFRTRLVPSAAALRRIHSRSFNQSWSYCVRPQKPTLPLKSFRTPMFTLVIEMLKSRESPEKVQTVRGKLLEVNRVHTQVDQRVSRTLNQISMTKYFVKSQCIHNLKWHKWMRDSSLIKE